MSGRLSVRVDSGNLYTKFRILESTLAVELAETMEQVGKLGETEMKRIVKDRGTGWAKVRFRYGLGAPQGRAVTFRMYRSISHTVRRGAKQFQAVVGFLKNPQKYFTYQDEGFTNKWRFVGFGPGTSGPNANKGFLFAPARPRKTEGMHALRDARELMKKELPRVAKLAERRISRKINGK